MEHANCAALFKLHPLKKESSLVFYSNFPSGDALILTVHPSEYMEQLVDYCLVKVYAVLRVAETHQFWSQEDDFSLVKPKLQVQQLGQLYAGRLGRLRLSFANPLEGTTALTNGYVTIECPGAFSQIRERCDVVYRNFSHDLRTKMAYRLRLPDKNRNKQD